jgi:alkyl hydroperoxide reductase subunit AhpF
LLSDEDHKKIQQIFDENLVDPVKLIFFTIPASQLIVPGRESCETCNDVQEIVEEIAGISDKLSVEVHNVERERDVAQRYGVDRVPAIVLATGDEARVRYFGGPFGNEFMTFLTDIQSISRSQTILSQPTRDALAAITDPIHLQVFVTPT